MATDAQRKIEIPDVENCLLNVKQVALMLAVGEKDLRDKLNDGSAATYWPGLKFVRSPPGKNKGVTKYRFKKTTVLRVIADLPEVENTAKNFDAQN